MIHQEQYRALQMAEDLIAKREFRSFQNKDKWINEYIVDYCKERLGKWVYSWNRTNWYNGSCEWESGLLIIDTCDWKYEEMNILICFEDKLNNYLLYLDSKQYVQKYGDNFNEIIISIHFMYDLVENAVKYLNVVSQQLPEAGYTLHIHLPNKRMILKDHSWWFCMKGATIELWLCLMIKWFW